MWNIKKPNEHFLVHFSRLEKWKGHGWDSYLAEDYTSGEMPNWIVKFVLFDLGRLKGYQRIVVLFQMI